MIHIFKASVETAHVLMCLTCRLHLDSSDTSAFVSRHLKNRKQVRKVLFLTVTLGRIAGRSDCLGWWPTASAYKRFFFFLSASRAIIYRMFFFSLNAETGTAEALTNWRIPQGSKIFAFRWVGQSYRKLVIAVEAVLVGHVMAWPVLALIKVTWTVAPSYADVGRFSRGLCIQS